MIKILKGRYRSISMRIDKNLDVIVKAPRKLCDEKIEKFILQHKQWIVKQQNKIMIANLMLKNFDFENNIYIFGKAINGKNNKQKEYTNLFNEIIVGLLMQLSNQTKLTYNSIKMTNSIRIWGSMDKNKNMKLNIKLFCLPKELVEYVIIHELCHGIEFNHSKNFWKEVEKYCPNYKSNRNELEKYRAILRVKIF